MLEAQMAEPWVLATQLLQNKISIESGETVTYKETIVSAGYLGTTGKQTGEENMMKWYRRNSSECRGQMATKGCLAATWETKWSWQLFCSGRTRELPGDQKNHLQLESARKCRTLLPEQPSTVYSCWVTCIQAPAAATAQRKPAGTPL